MKQIYSPKSPNRTPTRASDRLRCESLEPNSNEYQREMRGLYLSKHKSFTFGGNRSKAEEGAAGFPGMNSMQSRLGVRLNEGSHTGIVNMASVSASGSRDKSDLKATLSTAEGLGRLHLMALEEAAVEQQQALLPFVLNQRPLSELVPDESDVMTADLYAVTLQQYLDTVTAYGEVLQLQGKSDFALQCLLSCTEHIDSFLLAHIKQTLPADRQLPQADQQLAQQWTALFFPSAYVSKPTCGGLMRWWSSACACSILSRPLADFAKRLSVLLKINGHLEKALIAAKASVELFKIEAASEDESTFLLASAYSLLTCILQELGRGPQAAQADCLALDLLARCPVRPLSVRE